MEKTLNELQATIDDFLDMNLLAANWKHKPSADKWSKNEILGHLIDSAQLNLQRFIRCTYEENFKLIYHQGEWVRTNCYQEASTDDLLALWELLNMRLIRVLRNYPPGRSQAKCDTGKTTGGMHTVQWLAADYLAHLTHHLNQITSSAA